MLTPQPACPECEKLSAVAEKSNIIGEFLDYFLPNKGVVLAKWVDNENEYGENEVLVPAYEYRNETGINNLLAEYFEIDMKKVEEERMALLEWLRSNHGE